MALIVESGSGVAGAESYASTAFADTYWGARTHLASSSTWLAATTAHKEGALREATAFVDATYAPYYRGIQAGTVQGLLWPRSGAVDDAGYDLPGLPVAMQNAACELAARALAATLAPDLARGGAIKTEKVDVLSVTYFDGAQAGTTYGVVEGIIQSLLDGTQGDNPVWLWA